MPDVIELRQITVQGTGGKTARVRVVEETEDTYYVTIETDTSAPARRGEGRATARLPEGGRR